MNSIFDAIGWRRAASLAALLGVLGVLAMGHSRLHAQTAPAANAATSPTAKAVFAGGCFWCVEADFDKVPGVISTISGYIGGSVANPTYQQVSGNLTGHAEAVEIVFDPAKVSYAQLVEHFWRTMFHHQSSPCASW